MLSNESESEGGVAVVGSSNADLVNFVSKLPKSGESIQSLDFEQQFGGKGANQAMCIAKISSPNAKLVFVGAVGSDEYGKQMIENFKSNRFQNVENNVRMINNSVTGQASICVEKSSGNNIIVLVGGANMLITEEMINHSWEDIKQCKVLVCQNEIPLNVSYYALKKAKEEGLITIWNTAPAINLLNLSNELKDICNYVDYLIPNEHEAAILIGEDDSSLSFNNDQEIERSCKVLFDKLHVNNIIITLGEKGCAAYYLDEEKNDHVFKFVPAEKVENVVDSTGAGDAWVGSFAYFLSCEIPVIDSMNLSNFIAGITVQYKGAQLSYNALNSKTVLEKFEL
ncbi:hypothetical protein ABK040_001324 [Willaertia magna]